MNCSANVHEMAEASIAPAEMWERGDGVLADIRSACKYYLISADDRQP